MDGLGSRNFRLYFNFDPGIILEFAKLFFFQSNGRKNRRGLCFFLQLALAIPSTDFYFLPQVGGVLKIELTFLGDRAAYASIKCGFAIAPIH